jgi:cytochrome P450
MSTLRGGRAVTETVSTLFGPDMLADPYARYAQIRGPVAWNEQMGLWLVTRYEDVRWALGRAEALLNHAVARRRFRGPVIGLAC